MRKARKDPDCLEYLSVEMELSDLYRNIGEYDKSLEIQQGMLERVERLFGPVHPDTRIWGAGHISYCFYFKLSCFCGKITLILFFVRKPCSGRKCPA